MNGRIDHTNYEAWLLDRLEGNLTPAQERELDTFLLLHPHLAPLDDELPTVATLTDALSGADKAALKRTMPPVGHVNDATVEDHLVARLEGDLDADQLEALRAYLAAHPEWHTAERTYALTKLVPEAMAFAAKHGLVRHLPPQGMPTPHTLTDFLIARAEGDLTPGQEQALARLVAGNARHEREWALVQAARTVAEPVVFKDKAALKKKEGRVIAFWAYRLAVAASVALLIATGVWLLRTPDDDGGRFARVPVTKPEQGVQPQDQPQHNDAAPPPDTTAQPLPENVDKGSSGATDDRLEPVKGGRDVLRSVPATQHVPETPAMPVEEPMLAHEPVHAMPSPEGTPAPDEVEEQLAHVDPVAAPPAVQHPTVERTVGGLLAATLRERVLDTPAREAAPLDRDDAMAAVDRTLKVVAGERAGIAVDRRGDGHVQGFSLRLGRNLSISARR